MVHTCFDLNTFPQKRAGWREGGGGGGRGGGNRHLPHNSGCQIFLKGPPFGISLRNPFLVDQS